MTAHFSGPADEQLDQSVQAQALHLRRLSPRLDQLTADQVDLRRHIDQIAEIADELRCALEEPHSTAAPGPPSWPTMNADQATSAWGSLADWIGEVFVPWYGITREQLPGCCALHRSVVVELSWLQHIHHAAYQPGAATHLIAGWHNHNKPAVLRRVHDAIPRRGLHACSPGHHLATDAERNLRSEHPPASSTAVITRLPRPPLSEQLASREHWRSFFHQAVAADIAAR